MSLIVRMVGANALSPELNRAAKDMGTLDKSVGKAALGFAKFGAVAALALGAIGTKMAVDLEKGIREVGTLMGGLTNNQVKGMSKELRTLAVSSGQALDKLTKAKYDIVSAGFSSAAESARLLDASATLAVGGVTEVSTAADLLTTSLNAYNLSADKSTEISDKLFTIVRLGKTTVTELGGSMGQLLAIAGQAGVNLDEVGAAMATLTAAGQNTAISTTAIKASLIELQKPMGPLLDIIKQTGFQTGKALLDSEGYAGALKLIGDKAKETGKPLTEIFGNIRSMAAVLPLTGTAAEKFASNLVEMGRSAGASQAAFAEMEKSVSVQLDRLKQGMGSLLITIGEGILPVFGDLVMAANRFLAVPVSKSLRDEQREFNILVGIVKNANTAQDTRNKAIKELEAMYPQYLGDLDLEEGNILDIEVAQRKANAQFIERIRIASSQEVLKEQSDKLTQAQLKLFDATKAVSAAELEADGVHRTITATMRGETSVRDLTLESLRFLQAEMIDARAAVVEEEVALTELTEALRSLGLEMDIVAGKPVIRVRPEGGAGDGDGDGGGGGETPAERTEREQAEDLEKWNEGFANITSATAEYSSAIGGLYSALADKKTAAISRGLHDSLKAEAATYKTAQGMLIDAKNAELASIREANTVEGKITQEGQRLISEATATHNEAIASSTRDHNETVQSLNDQAETDKLEALRALKPVKYAQAVSSIAVGVAGALGAQPWTPANFGLAALVGAAGLVQLSAIAASPYEFGGVGVPRGTDSVNAVLTEGEMVSTVAASNQFGNEIADMNQRAETGDGGGSGSISITIVAMDGADVERVLVGNPEALARGIKEAVENRHLLMANKAGIVSVAG